MSADSARSSRFEQLGGLAQLLVVEARRPSRRTPRTRSHLRPSSGPDPCRCWRRAASRTGCSGGRTNGAWSWGQSWARVIRYAASARARHAEVENPVTSALDALPPVRSGPLTLRACLRRCPAATDPACGNFAAGRCHRMPRGGVSSDGLGEIQTVRRLEPRSPQLGALGAQGVRGCQRSAVLVVLLLVAGSPSGDASSGGSPAGTSSAARACRSGWCGGTAGVGGMSVRISVLLSYYANDLFSALQVAFQGSGSSDDALKDSWYRRLLAVDGDIRRAGDVLVVSLPGRPLPDPAVRAPMAGLVDATACSTTGSTDTRTSAVSSPSRPIDNPDQRIQQDIDIVTAVTGEPNTPAARFGRMLLFGAVESVLSVASFGVILWQLSGPLTMLERDDAPRRCSGSSSSTCWRPRSSRSGSGRPLIRLSFLNEMRNASFRYAMIRVKESASAVGLYRGEDVERATVARQADWHCHELPAAG